MGHARWTAVAWIVCCFTSDVDGFIQSKSLSLRYQKLGKKEYVNTFSARRDNVGAEDEVEGFVVTPEKILISNGGGSKEDSWNGYAMPTGKSYSAMLDEPVFSRILTGRPIKDLDDENEDGWGAMRRKKRSFFKSLLKLPFRIHDAIVSGGVKPKEPGTLILVRHGESLWNANKTFTGWADPGLSERGVREVEHAARLLLEEGYEIDVVFTSRLQRAIRSVWIILQEMNQVYLPVFKSWRLNERMYGALTGLSKIQTAEQLGHDLVQQWRGSLRARPPEVTTSHPYWPGRERRYADLRADQVPKTESLEDCMERTIPLWNNKILYELRNGKNVMVVAHANTLRGLVKKIDSVSDEDIQNVAIPTGIPIIYKFDKNLNPIPPLPSGKRQAAMQVHMNGLFLEKPGLLKEALAREAEWSQFVPGYNPTMERTKNPMGTLERSLYKLQAERELKKWAGQFIDPDAEPQDDGTDGNDGKPMLLKLLSNGEDDDSDEVFRKMKNLETSQGNSDVNGNRAVTHLSSTGAAVFANTVTQPCVAGMPSPSVLPGLGFARIRKDPVIVMIRHGKTEHNKLGLFTGWEDVPLAKDGVLEAQEAGRLLKAHGFEFDVVYTSWLSRAIETAWHVSDQMDCTWLPIVKTWRLNERMYGQLTGLSKQMVKQRHGEKQFKEWRRGYNTPPPKVSSFSQHYPGNDRRYQKFVSDVRYSFRESIIRSIESGRPSLALKLPKSESLKDCMQRTVPFFTKKIVPEAIDQGKRVLISSSENAIRGLLMHLCEIPEDKITGLEIPNGLPLIFDIKSKCVKLLDDGSGINPLDKYNFGSAASYLFRPCQNEDGSPDEECSISSFGMGGEQGQLALTSEELATIEAIRTKGQPAPTIG